MPTEDTAQTVALNAATNKGYADALAEAAAQLIAQLRAAEAPERRALIAHISGTGVRAGLDADTAAQLAHLINVRAQA